MLLRQSRPGEAPFGRLELQAEVQLHMAGDGQGFVRMDDQLGRRCEFRGPYGQSGKLMRFSGGFTCSSGDAAAGTFEIADLEVSPNGITGTLRMDSPGLRQMGRFAAVLQ